MDVATRNELQKWIFLSEECSRRSLALFPGYVGPLCNSSMNNFVFRLCLQLKTPEEVIFKVMEYFDHYMTVILRPDEKRCAYHHSHLTRNKRKNLLRLIAMVQIATKITYRHKVLKTREAASVLGRIGIPVETKEILQEELKVLHRLEPILNGRTLDDSLEFCIFVMRQKYARFVIDNKYDWITYVYCAAPYFISQLEKLGFSFTSKFDLNLLLSFGIIISVSLLRKREEEVIHAADIVQLLTRWTRPDVLKVAFVILDSV
ncbi:hypothetical protein CRM22_008658 [Opisthorchis felineus]|uniref:Cyclin N-terminal domain-containing protein n=1 Tax=Opisthorchis felineus TaxID=147828 RepID=A0A4S2LH81_OPIFE|nr:hypothetical protein CRM22_008658 [Opisthorchis felineus]